MKQENIMINGLTTDFGNPPPADWRFYNIYYTKIR